MITSHRGRRVVVEEPIEEPEFPDTEPVAATGETDEDEEIVPEADREEEPEEDEEEEY